MSSRVLKEKISLEEIQDALLLLKKYCETMKKPNNGVCPSECSLCLHGSCMVCNESYFDYISSWKINTLDKPPIHKFFLDRQ